MAGKHAQDNSKKAQGNARKAEAAAQKAAAENAKKEAEAAADWQNGAKTNAKKEAEAAKKAEAARKKAERDALLAEEEKNTPGRAAPKKSKGAVKKATRGLDLSQLDSSDGDNRPLSAINASGIDNALDALSLTASSDAAKIDRHPERRFKAAYAQFEERRLGEMDADGTGAGLRLNQKKEKIKKEFEKSPENPFNQVTASYDTSKEELAKIKQQERDKIEARSAGLKQACASGVFVSLTPGDPSLWSGVIFVRKGPYAPAVLRFQISFPDTYPALPPLVTFSTDMFHPLITPLTTYMYTTDIQDNGTVSATDEERLPPGGFSLRHGFPDWFGRGSRSRQTSGQQQQQQQQQQHKPDQTPPRSSMAGGSVNSTPQSHSGLTASSASSSTSTPGGFNGQRGKREVSTYEVLRYIRSTFDDEDVLDSIPLEAAGNPGAWHAWRTYRRKHLDTAGTVDVKGASGTAPAARRPGEWNWEGVWEERSKRGITASLSDAVLYGNAGAADEVINFLSMDDHDIEAAKRNLLRTLGATA
ncbi:hypothetical protein QBC46DRAFT_361628 [Diplogelasinospora grovesii]|uniref:UBC core domain-containing protein n=1 Tax=Diplogelasinospora grovesii TaxID=303347 RepID=A0AAN6S7F8_9PEZI|nr:hypothetical protein QBC46DRAFT_361628 [Diplogelasinospora grovesii]